MNSQQLWLPVQDLYKLKPATFPVWSVATTGAPPRARVPLTLGGFWGKKSNFRQG